MANTYNATRAAAGVEPVYDATGTISVISSFNLANGEPGLANGDVINILTLPDTAQIVGLAVDAPALDSNGAPTLTWEIGDATNGAGAFISGATVGRTNGGQQGPNVVGWAGYAAYGAATTLQFKVTAGPATTTTTGTINFVVQYTCRYASP